MKNSLCKKPQQEMIFEGMQVEIIEINGEPYFEIYSTGMALGHAKWNGRRTSCTPAKDRIDKNIESAGITTVVRNAQQYISEEQLYDLMLEMKTDKVKPFRKWVTSEVLPTLRKTGSYSMQGVDINKVLAEFKGQIIGLVDEQIGNAVKQVEKKCSEYYKPSCADKTSISHYIKKRLGITKADEEYELVKERVLIKLGASKWEDVDVETLRNSMDIIDESIRVLKMERPYEQTSLFDRKGA